MRNGGAAEVMKKVISFVKEYEIIGHLILLAEMYVIGCILFSLS